MPVKRKPDYDIESNRPKKFFKSWNHGEQLNPGSLSKSLFNPNETLTYEHIQCDTDDHILNSQSHIIPCRICFQGVPTSSWAEHLKSKVHRDMKTKLKKYVILYCFDCEKPIATPPSLNIKSTMWNNHLMSSQHTKKEKKNFKSAEKFCAVCKVKHKETGWLKHISSREHIRNCRKLDQEVERRLRKK